jgi:hypothetical protein
MPKHVISNTEPFLGDLSGTLLNPTVSKLAGKTIDDTGKADGRVLIYRSASDTFKYEAVPNTLPIQNQAHTAALGTTTSVTYVNAATITINVAGSYLCIYSDNLYNTVGGATMYYAIRVDRNDGNGIVTLEDTERICDINSQVVYYFPTVTQAYIENLKVGDIVYGSVSTDIGTLNASKRQMYALRLI